MESTIKKRTLKLQNEFTPERFERTSKTLRDLEGIIEVSTKAVDNLTLEYDLREVNLNKIEKFMKRLEVSFSRSLLQKFKRGWINFIEENEAGNLRSVPTDCCSVPTKKT